MSRWRGFRALVSTVAVVASAGCGIGKSSGGSSGSGGAGNSAGAPGLASGGGGGAQETGGATGAAGLGGQAGTTGAPGGATAAGGQGVGGTAGGCGDRLTAAEAGSLYRGYLFTKNPNYNPTVVVEARELVVSGLWEGLNAQLFDVHPEFPSDGAFYRDRTMLTHACQVFLPAVSFDIPYPLSSGLVANGALYASWRAGDMPRSRLVKMVPDGAQFTTTFSPEYENVGLTPAPLVLQMSGADILVLRIPSTNLFNEWSTAEPIGKLKDLGDSLVVVDGSGNPVPIPVP